MDVLLWVYLGFFAFFALILVFLLGWMQVPWNEAKLRRIFQKKKNYVVVFIRMGGGQLITYVVPHNEPVISIGDRKYTPDESAVANKGSVPVFAFNYDDMKPIPLTGVKIEDNFRDSAYVGHVMMKMKALYEAKATIELMSLLKDQKKFFMLALIGVGVCIVLLIYLLIQINGLNSLINSLGGEVYAWKTAAGAVVPNALPAG